MYLSQKCKDQEDWEESLKE